jgi:hypothetical protein
MTIGHLHGQKTHCSAEVLDACNPFSVTVTVVTAAGISVARIVWLMDPQVQRDTGGNRSPSEKIERNVNARVDVNWGRQFDGKDDEGPDKRVLGLGELISRSYG